MWRRVFPDWRGLPRAYWLVWGGTLVNRFGTFVLPFLSLYLTQRRQFSASEAGMVASLYGAGTLAAGPVGGILADYIGRRKTIIASLTLGAFTVMLLSTARTLPHFSAGAFVLGMMGDMYRPAVSALVADVVPAADRPRAYAFLYWAVNLAVACGVPVAGVIAGFNPRWLFLGDGTTSLLFAIIVWVGVRETRPAERTSEPARGIFSAAVLNDTLFLCFIPLVFLMAVAFMQHQTAMPIDMGKHGLSIRQFGLIGAINPALIVFLQPTMGQVAKGFDRLRVVAFGAFLIGIGLGLNAFAGSLPVYAGGIVLWTLGEMFALPIASAIVSDLAPARARGNYLGLYQGAWGAANLAGPLFGGFLLEQYGSRVLWLSTFALGACATWGFYLLASPMKSRLIAGRTSA